MTNSRSNRRTLIAISAAALLLGGAFSAQARGERHRSADVAIPVEGIVQILTFDGYQDIRAIELEHGAYRVQARNPAGEPVRLRVDPNTGEYWLKGTQPPQVGTIIQHRQVAQLAPSSGTVNPMAEPMWPSGRF